MIELNNIKFEKLKYIITYYNKPFKSRIIYFHYFKIKNYVIRIKVDNYDSRIIYDDIFIYNNFLRLQYVYSNYEKSYYPNINSHIPIYNFKKCREFLSQVPIDNIFNNMKEIKDDSLILKDINFYLRKEKIKKLLQN